MPYALGTGADRFEGDLIQDILISEKIGESPVNLKRRIRKQAEARTKKYFDGTDSDDYLFADVFETVDRRIAVSAPAVNKSVTDEQTVFGDDHELNLLFDEINGRIAS